jgi:hypothetical protein
MRAEDDGKCEPFGQNENCCNPTVQARAITLWATKGVDLVARQGRTTLHQNGTPARFRLVRIVCKVCTRLTVANPVSRCVS